MSDNLTYIFVYGTLLKGFRNSHFLETHECLCDNSMTLDHGEMLMFFDRPYIHFNTNKYPILGAIYLIDSIMLEQLDKLEGHPQWYQRVEKKIYSHNLSKEITAFLYEINDVPEIPFSNSSDVGCYKTAMINYRGDCASSYKVIAGKLIKVK